ncbi:MAG: GxxExxY protein [Thermoguttaceae bacterium]
MLELLYKDECYRIQGAIYEVYRQMGCGFLEEVYQECLAREFLAQKIPFATQQRIELKYKGELLDKFYIADFVCFNCIILELKAVSAVGPAHRAQIINYLKATEIKLGLLVNFGSHPKATIDRFAN